MKSDRLILDAYRSVSVQREHVVTTLAGFLVAAGVFAVMFWLLDAGEIVAAMRGGDPWLLAAFAATILLWQVFWGLALWNVLVAAGVDLPVRDAVLVNAGSSFANHVTPFGQAGGEPVAAWLLTRSARTDYEVSLASIASLDAINVIPSLSFAAVGAAYYLNTSIGARLGTIPAGVLAVAAGLPVVGTVAWRYRWSVERRANAVLTAVVRRSAALLPRLSPPEPETVSERLDGFLAALERVATSRRRLVAAIGFSAMGWGVQAVGLWITFLALGSAVPIYLPFFVLPIGKIGGVLPTPGGLGGTEAINVTLLTLMTTIAAPTIVAAVTIHSVGGYLLSTSTGAAAASVLKLRW